MRLSGTKARRMTVDEYIDGFDGEVKTRLIALRRIVHAEAPDAIEGVSYGMIGYKLDKKPLLYFGGFTSHIGLYPTPAGQEAFAAELAQYKTGKGSVQLPLGQPLPVQLIEQMVRTRVAQVRA